MTSPKRSVVASGILVLLVGGMGVACGSDPAPMPAIPENPSSTVTAPPPPVDGGPGPDAADAGSLQGLPPPEPAKQDEVTEAFGVFVSKAGPDDGDGSRAKPYNTIARGMQDAETMKKRLYVCTGTYTEAVVLKDGVSVIANLVCVDPTKWVLGASRTTIASPTSPAVTAKDIVSATRVDGLEVIAPPGSEANASSIALLAIDSRGLTMTLGKLEAGTGLNGVNGTTPTPMTQVVLSSVSGAAPPADCYRGATNLRCTETSYTQRGGQLGGRIQCNQGGTPGPILSGGNGGSSTVFRPNSNAAIVFGTEGLVGTPGGAPGVPGSSSSGGAFSDQGYQPGDGVKGTDGAVGASGKGGTPNVLNELGPPPPVTGVAWGWNGGGGGAGGCAGLAGSAGTGGGASIGALLVRSPVRFEKMTIRSTRGGDGGRGTFGTPPTPGQAAADPVNAICFPCAAAGQPGRPAGISGHGAGGPSVGIVASATAKPALVDTQVFHAEAGLSPAAQSEGGTTIPAAQPATAADTFDL